MFAPLLCNPWTCIPVFGEFNLMLKEWQLKPSPTIKKKFIFFIKTEIKKINRYVPYLVWTSLEAFWIEKVMRQKQSRSRWQNNEKKDVQKFIEKVVVRNITIIN